MTRASGPDVEQVLGETLEDGPHSFEVFVAAGRHDVELADLRLCRRLAQRRIHHRSAFFRDERSQLQRRCRHRRTEVDDDRSGFQVLDNPVVTQHDTLYGI